MASDCRVVALKEDVEGEVCSFFGPGRSAAGSRLVSPVISIAAVCLAITGAYSKGSVPLESQSSLLGVFDALDCIVLPPRPLLLTAFEWVRIGMAVSVPLPRPIQQLCCTQSCPHPSSFIRRVAVSERT